MFKQEKFNKIITKNFDYDFDINERGLYVISISASCRSGKQTNERGGEDLRIEIDGEKLREVPAVNKTQYKDIATTWNGTKLKGLKKTIIFILWLYHKAQGITNDKKRYWRSWKDAVVGYGPGEQKYIDDICRIYENGTDQDGKIFLAGLVY